MKTTDVNTRNHLAYARLLIQEALRHGGTGWLDYDRVFRKQVAIDPTLQWNSLMPGLHTSTILSTRNGTGLFCTLCKGSDHPNTTCALTYLHHQCMPPLAPTQTSTSSRRPPKTTGIHAPHLCVLEQRPLCLPRDMHLPACMCDVSGRTQGKRMSQDLTRVGIQDPITPVAGWPSLYHNRHLNHSSEPYPLPGTCYTSFIYQLFFVYYIVILSLCALVLTLFYYLAVMLSGRTRMSDSMLWGLMMTYG